MSASNYSKDQIEEKRLLALRRKAEKDLKNFSAPGCSTDSNKSLSNKSNAWNSGFKQTNIQSPNKWNSPKTENNGKFIGAMRTPKTYNNRPNPIKPKNFFGKQQTVAGTCSMITESRFMVDVDYHQKLIDIFKQIPSKLYDQQTRRWSFLLSDYDLVMSQCKALSPEVSVAGIPKYVLETFKRNEKTSDPQFIDLSRIDNKLTECLMPFQREGISYGILKHARCFIADDMGLGKTIQALGLAHYYRDDWPLLIITPSSVRYQWSESIFTFLPSVPTQYVHHYTSGKDFVGNARILIISYDLLVRSINVLQHHAFGFVILDESHSIKSGKTARAKAVQTIAKNAEHVVLLSGTPALSRPVELYSQISLIVPSFMSFHDYGVRYCAAEKKSFGWDYSGSCNMQELHILLKHCGMIRRLKSDVLKQLPDKIRQVVILDPTLIREASEESKKIAERLHGSSLKYSDRERVILQLYHESAEQRIKAVCNHLGDLLDREQKFLVFAHHQIVLDSITSYLVKKDIKFIRIDGKTHPEQRKTQVDLFQDSPSCLVAILSITAANAGVTLTAAQLVVFAELFWNPGILCQAEDRVHRIGQDSNVVIQYLVARGTVDDHLWPLIERKIKVLSKVGLDQGFCLDKADVSNQKITDKPTTPKKRGQMSMDAFVTTSPSNERNSSLTEDQTSDKTTEDYDHLLEFDELDFADLDLDNIS